MTDVTQPDVRKITAEETLALRNAVLRPHQSVEQCRYPGDNDPPAAHFGVFEAGAIVGIVSVYPQHNPAIDSAQCWQLRALATVETVRGRGYAICLLRHAERHAIEHGADVIWCNSRRTAAGFYLKRGYQAVGEEFVIEDVGPHSLLYKTIS